MKYHECDFELKKYFISCCKTETEDFNEYVIKNNLPFFLMENPDKSKQKIHLSNAIYDKISKNELKILNDLFKLHDITPVFFKGLVLAEILYDKTYDRKVGDIDIFVCQEKYKEACSVLISNGYTIYKKEDKVEKHHITFIKGLFCVELHKTFLSPRLEIDESFLRKSLKNIKIDGESVCTFDISGGFLHLLYHLYMDLFIVFEYIDYKLVAGKLPVADRFLYRCYEISRYSELYRSEIYWNDIRDDILSQSLNISFSLMIRWIRNIFPATFPDTFLLPIFSKEYLQCYDPFNVFNYLSHVELDNIDIGSHNGKQLDTLWNRINNNRKTDNLISILSLSGTDGLNASLVIDDDKEGLVLKIHINMKSALIVSDKDQFEPTESDGIHIMLCAATPYQYISVFIFPKIEDERVIAVPYDFINNEIFEDGSIASDITITEDGYNIIINIKKEIVNLDDYEHFYIGLIVSECDCKSGKRHNELIHTLEKDKWYDPTRFYRVRRIDDEYLFEKPICSG